MHFEGFVEKIYDSYAALESRISHRYRQHLNRRTMSIVVVGTLIFFLGYENFVAPPDDFPTGNLVSVEQGLSTNAIGQALAASHVVRSAFVFRAVITLLGGAKDARAGDYVFNQPQSVIQVARTIAAGNFGLEPFRFFIPEGATIKEMAHVFSHSLPRFNELAFLSVAQPQEGYLFPNTYFFLPNATEKQVIDTMRQAFDSQVVSIQPQINSFTKAQKLTLSDVVIMASILEREARTTDDRRKIAGVLWNRLAKGMPLQVDATFVYTHDKGSRQLTLTDLADTTNPYNTYRKKGLPYGPIGSPSLDALLAAVTPIESDNLFYLADRRGVTHYAVTYAEHLKNKARYIDN